MTRPASPDMIEGYLDGYNDTRETLPDNHNRTKAYEHGWLNGRDDRVGKPRATAQEIREAADRALEEEVHIFG